MKINYTKNDIDKTANVVMIFYFLNYQDFVEWIDSKMQYKLNYILY